MWCRYLCNCYEPVAIEVLVEYITRTTLHNTHNKYLYCLKVIEVEQICVGSFDSVAYHLSAYSLVGFKMSCMTVRDLVI